MLSLTEPTVEYESSYKSYIRELGDSERYPFPLDYAHDDFHALVTRLRDYSSGVDLADDMVPNTTFWLIENDEIVGVSNVRHRLTEKLELIGGHIGFGVRPSAQGRGVAKELLKRSVDYARGLGIDDVVLICLKENTASSAVIRANGGKLESDYSVPEYTGTLQRFVIKGGVDTSP